ncbi:hypothetical protein EC973_001084 [Apophysomyces ossiformis]|uniref:Suppressor of anucleate metulae protein B n=1 Tax=Apophysomyces ossiformis TaxID=679940 RepID=A0A8H7BUB5_9FUNG|nr:hypothetical protein EC973_001084 [Apophysomyces ossiformis]
MDSKSALHDYLKKCHLLLEPCQDATKGRAVIALEEHKRGSILTTSQPLGTVPLQSSQSDYCNYCFRRPRQTQLEVSTLQRCSRCKSAYFCDMACFKNAWLSYHQFVCKPRSHRGEGEEGEEEETESDQEMLERVALNVSRYNKRKSAQSDPSVRPAEAQENVAAEETVEVTMEAFFSLMDHYDDHSKALLQKYRSIADRVMDKAYIADTGLQQKELIQMLCRFRCNNFAIHDDQLFAIGEGTYPIASLFNHSCRPNAIIMFDGALLILKAIENIEPGEEVTIAYVDTVHSRTYRQQFLCDKYFFQCRCVRCSDENPVFGGIDALLGEEESDWDRAENLLHPNEGISATLLKEIEAWDLLALSRQYDRKHNNVPKAPLNLSTYTHGLLQRFTPYLWSVSNPELVHSSPAPSPGRIPPQFPHFDDPLPLSARPPVPENYADIIAEGVSFIRAMLPKSNDSLVASRLTTLSASTRLFYDEIAANRWLNATKLGMYILTQYCLVYPPYHPMLGQHTLLLAKAGWNYFVQADISGVQLEKVYERGVRRWIALAKENIECSFGKNSVQWRDVVELEWIFMREQKLKQ